MVPSTVPSAIPTSSPSFTGSGVPSNSGNPSYEPSIAPSLSLEPSLTPSSVPSISALPTLKHSNLPSTSIVPTEIPSSIPSSYPSMKASEAPSYSSKPSSGPSGSPSLSVWPSFDPTNRPSDSPSPTLTHSAQPSMSHMPSVVPSVTPSNVPSSKASAAPTSSSRPSHEPSLSPSLSKIPSSPPSDRPSASAAPTLKHSAQPSVSNFPSQNPTYVPTQLKSGQPSDSQSPSTNPSTIPSASLLPSSNPSTFPTMTPSNAPTPDCEQVILDFDAVGDTILPGGHFIEGSEWRDTLGIEISFEPSKVEPNEVLRLFDSSTPHPNDADLGTPNQNCVPGGPGVSYPFNPAAKKTNCIDQGNVLIIQNDYTSYPNDSRYGGTIIFNFNAMPAEVISIGLLDVEARFGDAVEIMYADSSKPANRYAIDGLGDNAVTNVSIPDGKDVASLRVKFERSGAITHLTFCKLDISTPLPTSEPTDSPTTRPSHAPTSSPTKAPTSLPTDSPTEAPTMQPSGLPTVPQAMGQMGQFSPDFSREVVVAVDTLSVQAQKLEHGICVVGAEAVSAKPSIESLYHYDVFESVSIFTKPFGDVINSTGFIENWEQSDCAGGVLLRSSKRHVKNNKFNIILDVEASDPFQVCFFVADKKNRDGGLNSGLPRMAFHESTAPIRYYAPFDEDKDESDDADDDEADESGNIFAASPNNGDGRRSMLRGSQRKHRARPDNSSVPQIDRRGLQYEYLGLEHVVTRTYCRTYSSPPWR